MAPDPLPRAAARHTDNGAPRDHAADHDEARHLTQVELEGARASSTVHAFADNFAVVGPDLHLVLNPAGAFVVASAWHESGATTRSLCREAARTAGIAGEIHSHLGSRGDPVDIRPIVAVWGPAQRDVPAGGGEFAGVFFIRGCELRPFLAWSAEFGGCRSREQAVDSLIDLHACSAA